MTKGYYGGFTFGWPTPIGGIGGGLYFDNHENFYPQFYYGTPGWGVSVGHSPDLDELLTGTSVSGSFGRRSIGPNLGASNSSIGVGIGTPGFGATYGWGPYKVDPAPLEAIGEINPAIYSTGFDLPHVDRQDSFGDRFGEWGYSPSGIAPPSAPGLHGQLNGRFGSWGTAPADNSDNPGSPVLRELEKYRRAAASDRASPGVGANNAPAQPGASVFDTGAPKDSFDDRFGNWGYSSSGIAPPSAPGLPGQLSSRFGSWGMAPADNPDDPRSPVLRELEKYRRAAASDRAPPGVGANSVPAQLGTSVFDTGAPAVPFVPPTQSALAPAPPASFGGNWGASAPANAPVSAPEQMSSPQGTGAKPLDRKDIRILARVMPDGSIIYPPTSIPNTPAPPQPDRLPGLVSGEPMPKYPVPPMLFGLPDRSAASGDNMDDWFTRWNIAVTRCSCG